ncbi:MAG: DUF5678 domain-containing protein [Desulfurococcales archaeon]|nr:DUF5678 domain-containing protein [Desulfurococcales archaeon]
MPASTSRSVKLVKPGELDQIPPGCWAAIIDGKVIAWADSLQKLLSIMENKGYKRNEYAVIKVPPDELLVAKVG